MTLYPAQPAGAFSMQRLSTYSQKDTDKSESEEDRFSDRFEETVWDDERICNNCYRQIAEVEERNYHVTPDGREGVRVEEVRDMVKDLAPEEYRRVVAESAHDSPLTRGMTGACKCGAVHRTTVDRPVDTAQVFRLTARAINHYHDSGMAVNGGMALARVAHEMRDPDRQHEQDEIIAEACDCSLQHG